MNVVELPAHKLTRLVRKPNDKRQPTPEQSTDATTALTRGLAEYVRSMPPKSGPDGRDVYFQACYDAWAQPENLAAYPAFIAFTNDNDGRYTTAGGFSPRVAEHRYDDGSYEVTGATLEVEMKGEIWCNDPEERKLLCWALEEAFEPVDWMYGFRLELPHYFNQRATFEPVRIAYFGGAAEAIAGFFPARVILNASVPKTRLLGLPEYQRTEVRLTVTSGPVDESNQT